MMVYNHMSCPKYRPNSVSEQIVAERLGVLETLRETSLGRQRVEEIVRVHVDLSRERGLQPWRVVDRV